MARVMSGWLEFAGVKSSDMGVSLMEGARYVRPAWRGTALPAAGKSGDLWISDGAYETVEIKRRLRCRLSKLDSAAAWLTGSGRLRFSWAENRAYDARAAKSSDIAQVSPDADPLMEFEVTFTCQPFRRLVPEAEAFTISASGESFTNPGTAPSLPRVKITGSGDFSVSIGMETLFFSGVTGGGIIVDSELMDALTYDGELLANDHVSGTPFRIQPGVNAVSWLAEDGSSVTAVEILPRWRYL